MANLRAKNWHITINKGATCYSTFKEILSSESNCSYAYIIHDKDVNENGEPKETHVHIILIYQNARQFDTICNKFQGAHVEEAIHLNASIQYLMHINNPEKTRYSIDEVVSNCNLEPYLLPENEAFNPDALVDYYNEGYTTYLALYIRFGSQIQKYTTCINQVFKEMSMFVVRDANDYIEELKNKKNNS